MGASYGKLDPGHEEAIYTLKKAGKSGREIRELLARGYEKLPPVSISGSRANNIARRILDERDELYRSKIKDKPAPEGLRLLTRRLMLIAERETERLERSQRAGKLDAARLGKLAGAVTKLHTLLDVNAAAQPPEDGSAAQKGDSPDGQAASSPFASSLLDNADAAPPAPTQPGEAQPPPPPEPIGDVALRAPAPPVPAAA